MTADHQPPQSTALEIKPIGESVGISGRHGDVRNLLNDRSPKLAGMYDAAIQNLQTPCVIGYEAQRISIVCHCMREVMSGLPAVLADNATPRPNPSSGALLADLPNLLAEHGELDLDADQDVVPVPRPVAQALSLLVKARIQEDGRNRSNAAALVTGGTDPSHPAIKQWLDAYRFFVKWAHLDRIAEEHRELPDDDRILAEIRVVEDVIVVRTALFFENVHALQDLLAEINATVEEDQ